MYTSLTFQWTQGPDEENLLKLKREFTQIKKNVSQDCVEPLMQHTALQHTALQRTALQHTALQHTALQYTALQRTATHCTASRCNTMQHTVTYFQTLQHTATPDQMCSTRRIVPIRCVLQCVQCVAACCSVCSALQCVAVCCSVSHLPCNDMSCNALQCVAPCCRVLHRFAVGSYVLQYLAL